MFPPIWIWALAALAVSAGGYLGMESLKARGRAEALAGVERSTMEAELGAHEHQLRAAQAIDTVRREEAAKAAELETTLETLRHERAGDAESGAVVFDSRWDAWVRGGADRPGD